MPDTESGNGNQSVQSLHAGDVFHPYQYLEVFRHVVCVIQGDPELSFGAKVLYVRLCFYSGINGLCSPGQKTLADDLATSISCIKRFVRELRETEYIKAEPNGRRKSYHFIWHQLFATTVCSGSDLTPIEPTQLRSDPCDQQHSSDPTPMQSRSDPSDGSHSSDLTPDTAQIRPLQIKKDLKDLELKNLGSSATPPTPPATQAKSDRSNPDGPDLTPNADDQNQPPPDTDSRIDLFINTEAKGRGFHVSQFTSKQLQWLLDQDADSDFRERVLEAMGKLEQQDRCGNQREPLLRLLGAGRSRRQSMSGSLGRSGHGNALSISYGRNSGGSRGSRNGPNGRSGTKRVGGDRLMSDLTPEEQDALYDKAFEEASQGRREEKERLRKEAEEDKAAQRKISDRTYRQSAGLEPSDVPLTETEREQISEQWRAEADLQDKKEAEKLALEQAKKDADKKQYEENIARVKRRHPLQNMVDAEKLRKAQATEEVN